MATGSTNAIATPAAKVLFRIALYYIVITALGALVWRYLPRVGLIADDSLNALFGEATETVRGSGKNAVVVRPVGPGTLAATVALAMISATLVALPVAWIYTMTRAKRGYQQSVVQLLIMLPVVVAGILVMVIFGGLAGLVSIAAHSGDALIAVPILGGIGAFIFVLLLALSLPGIVAGFGLIELRPWARMLTIILSALELMSVPLGTALGIYGLWVLLSPSAEQLFRQPSPR